MSKAIFVDLTRCTACRGCQVACKQWKKLPAEKTEQTGSYQNPPDLAFNTIRVVRFNDVMIDGRVRWLFFPEQCRHCVLPPCKLTADVYVEGAIRRDESTGAVVYTALTAKLSPEEKEQVKAACPYNIPRIDEASGLMSKCDMCLDRLHNGEIPACVKVCPTSTMNFGDRDEMLALAEERLAKIRKRTPTAQLLNPDDVNVIYLAEFDPKLYYEWAMAEATPPGMDRRQMLARLLPPLRLLG